MKRLAKSSTNKVISGVCGGLAEYLNVDPTLVRLIWALLAFTGSGILVYIVAAIVMPYASHDTPPNEHDDHPNRYN